MDDARTDRMPEPGIPAAECRPFDVLRARDDGGAWVIPPGASAPARIAGLGDPAWVVETPDGLRFAPAWMVDAGSPPEEAAPASPDASGSWRDRPPLF